MPREDRVNSFVKANNTGKLGEYLWSEHLKELGWSIEQAPNKRFPDWDIKATKGEELYTYEVKLDIKAYYWADRRGKPEEPNLYIEYHNTERDRPSGIMMSKADYYVYCLKRNDDIKAYIYNRVQLLSFCQTGNFKVVGCDIFGDGNAIGWIPPLHITMVPESGFLKKVQL